MPNLRINNTNPNVGIKNSFPNVRVEESSGQKTAAVTTTTRLSIGSPIGLLLALTYAADSSFDTTTDATFFGYRPYMSIKSI